ncbi:MAG TPA: NADH-quinone oxidoreductase subunit C [Acidimicrobiia bacterium]
MAESPGATEAVPALREQAVDALTRLQAELGDSIVEHDGAFGDVVVRVRRDAWRRSAQVCKEGLGCDYLSFIAGIDWMPTPAVVEEGSGDTSTPAQPKEQTYGVAGSDGRYQLLALVESTRRKSWRVILKTDLPDDDLHAESWVSLYPGADWHEREAWEMYGFVFDGHPSLRHLYLPSEFEGHPLRKDYPLLAREVKPWPGLVDVEPMPGEPGDGDDTTSTETTAIEAGESA